jgi:hypothetical protein
MPEIIAGSESVVDQNAINPEVARQMEIALNGGFVPEKKEEAAAATATTATQPADIFQPFKEQFGYNTPEDALAEIKQLRQLRENPPTPMYEFENADSEKLFKWLQKGDTELPKVYEFIDKKMKIDSYLSKEVTPDTAPDIVKLGMQLKYKDLSPAEVEYKFRKQFSTPTKPAQGADEEQSDYDSRLSAWKDLIEDKKMELLIEAKLARPDIEAAKSKLVLPEIESAVDEGYIQYKKSLEEDQKLAAEAKEAYKVFNPKSIETKLNFKDEANKIDFDFQFEPSPETFQKAKDMVSDINLFWNNFFNQDGSPNRQKFLDAVYFATNKENVIMEAIKQGKNAAIKAMLPDNTQGGLVRQLVHSPEQETDVDKQFKQAGFIKNR